MDVPALGRDLLAEARRANERRFLVLAGERAAGEAAVRDLFDAVDVAVARTTVVGGRALLDAEHLPQSRAGRLLGTTRSAVVLDAHDGLDPNALARVVGAVDGGGLLVLLAPPLSGWPDRRDGFDETMAVPPFDVGDVGGRFRRRLVGTLRAQEGVAIVDVDAAVVERDGLTDPPPRAEETVPEPPDDHAFPAAAYAACRSADQVAAVHALEGLRDPGAAVVVEADRGRGKSAAAGLAAGSLAADGLDVLVTAPEYRNAAEVFERAPAVLDAVDAVDGDVTARDDPRRLDADGGGVVRFATPVEAAELPDDPDALVVDEAAALPVRLLARFLDAPSVAFVTTIHGYEGAGRGFSVRFRDRLGESDLSVTDVTMREPIRYAPGDPVEVWAFRALLLDARPAADQLVAGATPTDVEHAALAPADLVADEHLLREVFGLLVLAHYRTEPADLARLLDAPNVAVRALLADGHVVSVALLAREGGLPADLRAAMYDGVRVRGNMLPDVLTSQLRDEAAGDPVGQRVLRIATHHAVRSRGLGSHLLAAVRAEHAAEVDWLGTGYGATPELLSFWRRNGYATVHLATTRNDASGEYSALMLDPCSPAGRDLHDRHARWFCERVVDQLSDPLADADPDVVRAVLRATAITPTVDLTDREWRVVADTAYGPGLYTTAPGAFRRLALRWLVDPADPDRLDARAERLLVLKVLQGRRWSAVVDALGFHSHGEAMRALGRAFRPLVDAYGGAEAAAQRERYGE